MTPLTSNSSLGRAGIAAVVLGYAALSGLWILASDRAVEWLLADPTHIAVAHTLKGWGFIAVTSLLLYPARNRGDADAGHRRGEDPADCRLAGRAPG
jgi:hypothetical protein